MYFLDKLKQFKDYKEKKLKELAKNLEKDAAKELQKK